MGNAMEKPYSSLQRATQTSFSIVLPTPNTQTNLTHFPESKMANGPFWLKERGIGLRHHETWRQIQRSDIRHLFSSCRFSFVCLCSKSSFLEPLAPRIALHLRLCLRLILCLQELKVRGSFNEGQCSSLCYSTFLL